MERVLVGFGPTWRGFGLQHTRGLFCPSVNRWSIKWSPKDTKLDRRSTGSKPRPLGKSRSNPEMFNPHTRNKARNGHRRRTKRRNAKRTTGKMLGCMRRTCMQMRCTWWHDMKCMTRKKMTRKTTANHWKTPDTTVSGRYNTPPLREDLVPRSRMAPEGKRKRKRKVKLSCFFDQWVKPRTLRGWAI